MIGQKNKNFKKTSINTTNLRDSINQHEDRELSDIQSYTGSFFPASASIKSNFKRKSVKDIVEDDKYIYFENNNLVNRIEIKFICDSPPYRTILFLKEPKDTLNDLISKALNKFKSFPEYSDIKEISIVNLYYKSKDKQVFNISLPTTTSVVSGEEITPDHNYYCSLVSNDYWIKSNFFLESSTFNIKFSCECKIASKTKLTDFYYLLIRIGLDNWMKINKGENFNYMLESYNFNVDKTVTKKENQKGRVSFKKNPPYFININNTENRINIDSNFNSNNPVTIISYTDEVNLHLKFISLEELCFSYLKQDCTYSIRSIIRFNEISQMSFDDFINNEEYIFENTLLFSFVRKWIGLKKKNFQLKDYCNWIRPEDFNDNDDYFDKHSFNSEEDNSNSLEILLLLDYNVYEFEYNETIESASSDNKSLNCKLKSSSKRKLSMEDSNTILSSENKYSKFYKINASPTIKRIKSTAKITNDKLGQLITPFEIISMPESLKEKCFNNTENLFSNKDNDFKKIRRSNTSTKNVKSITSSRKQSEDNKILKNYVKNNNTANPSNKQNLHIDISSEHSNKKYDSIHSNKVKNILNEKTNLIKNELKEKLNRINFKTVFSSNSLSKVNINKIKNNQIDYIQRNYQIKKNYKKSDFSNNLKNTKDGVDVILKDIFNYSIFSLIILMLISVFFMLLTDFLAKNTNNSNN